MLTADVLMSYVHEQGKALGNHPFVRKNIESCDECLSLATALALHAPGPNSALTD